MGLEVGGILAFLVLVAEIWAIVQIIQSRVSMLAKVLWIVLILVVPVIGLIVWFFAGPRALRTS